MPTTTKQAIDGFLLNCRVEGKSWRTIDCYADKLKGFPPAQVFYDYLLQQVIKCYTRQY